MRPHVPDPLPLTGLDVGRLIGCIGPATAAISRYDGLLQSIVNPSVMLSPLTQREAVLSSRIEGTRATVDEVLEYEAGLLFDDEKSHDILDALFDRPIFRAANFGERSHVPAPTARSALRKLREAGVLEIMQESRGSQSAILAFPRLVNLAEGREVM